MKRLLEKDDFKEIYDIYMHESVVPFLLYDPMDQISFQPIFDELVAAQNFYVDLVEQYIAGFYQVERWPGRAQHVAALWSLALHPEHHGTGLAKTMIQELIDELRENGILRIQLMVEADNQKGIRFYEKLGFEKEGQLRKVYKRSDEDQYIDEFMMSLIF